MCMKTVATSTGGDDIAQAYDRHRIQKELRDFYKFTSYIRHGDYNSLYFLQQEKAQRHDPIDTLSQISVSPEIENEIDIDIDIGTNGSTKAIAMAYEKDSGESTSSFPIVSSTISASRSASKKDAITPLHSAFLARTRRTCASAPHGFRIPNMIDDSYTESIHSGGLNPNPALEDEGMSTSDYTSKTTASIADLKAKKRQIERNFETGKCAPNNSIVYDGYEFDIPIRLHRSLTARYI